MTDYIIYGSKSTPINYPLAFIGDAFVDELIAKNILIDNDIKDVIKTNEYEDKINDQIAGADLYCIYPDTTQSVAIDIKHLDEYTKTIPAKKIKWNKTNVIGTFDIVNNKLTFYLIPIGKLKDYMNKESIDIDFIKTNASFVYDASKYTEFYKQTWASIRRAKTHKWNPQTDSIDLVYRIFDGIMITAQLKKKLNDSFGMNPIIKLI